MNKLIKYLFLSLTFSLTFTLIAQEPPVKNTAPPVSDAKKTTSVEKKEALATLEKKYTKEELGEKNGYSPIAQLDPSFSVKEISYLRRAAHNGKGDVLDVQISIENNIAPKKEAKSKDAPLEDKDISRDYSIYVLAYHESKIPVINKLAPPPKWRDNDPNKLATTIDFSVLCPEKVTPKDVWGEEGLKVRDEISEDNKKKGYTYVTGEPSLNEYMLYLTRNPDKALPFKLYYESVPAAKATESNYKSSEAELKVDMNNTAATTHTFTIFNSKYKTTINTHHYSEHRPNFFFFNKVAVLIFDAKKTLVYRSIEDIGKKREHR